MRINVKAKPFSSFAKVEKVGQDSFEVWVKEPPARGLANMAIGNALAEYFNVSHAGVRLVFGFSSKNKIFEITLQD